MNDLAGQDAATSAKVSQSVNTTVTGLSHVSVDNSDPSPAPATTEILVTAYPSDPKDKRGPFKYIAVSAWTTRETF